MSEMIKRVARAIYLAQAKIDDQSGGENDLALQTDMHWESCLPHALAAIEAMREPTDEMCIAGQNSPKDYDTGLDPYSVWTDMIDRALK